MNEQTAKQIEKIFGARFEKNSNETVRKIESYGARYDPDSDLPAFDQLQICEAVAEATPVKENCGSSSDPMLNDNDVYKRKANGVVNESVNDKNSENRCLSDINELPKHKIVIELRKCNYRTPLKTIISLLEGLFRDYSSYSSHWKYIARSYTPRQINWGINHLFKLHQSGYPIINVAKLFTFLIKKRKKRKKLGLYQ